MQNTIDNRYDAYIWHDNQLAPIASCVDAKSYQRKIGMDLDHAEEIKPFALQPDLVFGIAAPTLKTEGYCFCSVGEEDEDKIIVVTADKANMDNFITWMTGLARQREIKKYNTRRS